MIVWLRSRHYLRARRAQRMRDDARRQHRLGRLAAALCPDPDWNWPKR